MLKRKKKGKMVNGVDEKNESNLKMNKMCIGEDR